MKFYVGLHQPGDADKFEHSFISIKRLPLTKRKPWNPRWWILDSGAFSEVMLHGRFLLTPEEYAWRGAYYKRFGILDAMVSQDFMCEAPALNKTGLTIPDHQRLTIERYDSILAALAAYPFKPYLMPVLQGYWPDEYVRHLRDYGNRIDPVEWVGVGSVCKRQGDLKAIEDVLMAIKAESPQLKIHGFGVKTTALESSIVRACLHSADSMAWSHHLRKNGGNANNWRGAEAFRKKIAEQKPRQRDYQACLYYDSNPTA